MTKYDIDRAKEFLKTIDIPQKYKNLFHYDVPYGWMNDPNGVIYAFGKYHIFYQYYPYDASPKDIHWGHAVTTDFITFETLPPAICPNQDYDCSGCWSGSAIFVDGKIYILYTGNSNGVQQQCLAVSEDGIHFKKYENNPVITSEMLPLGSDIHAFRDPYIIKEDDYFYILIGNKDLKNDRGRIICYRSKDLVNYDYVGEVFNTSINIDPGICECPSFFKTSTMDALITSLNFIKTHDDYQNFASGVMFYGKMDFSKGKFKVEGSRILDYGFDFYAPQVLNHDHRHMLISWCQMWEVTYPSQSENWVGSQTIPREIIIRDEITTFPIKEVLTRFKKIDELLIEDELELSTSIGRFQLNFFDIRGESIFVLKDAENIVSLKINEDEIEMKRSGRIPLNKSPIVDNVDTRICTIKNLKTIDIFIDRSIIEVYINGGQKVMTSCYYFDNEGKINILSRNNKVNLGIYKFL